MEQGRRPSCRDGPSARQARLALRRADAQCERALDLPGAAQGAEQAHRLSGARGAAVLGILGIAALTALLSIEHLTVRFGASAVVDDVSLTIDPGEKFAL